MVLKSVSGSQAAWAQILAPALTSLSLCLSFPKCKMKVKAPSSEGHCENWVNIAQRAPAAPGT